MPKFHPRACAQPSSISLELLRYVSLMKRLFYTATHFLVLTTSGALAQTTSQTLPPGWSIVPDQEQHDAEESVEDDDVGPTAEEGANPECG